MSEIPPRKDGHNSNFTPPPPTHPGAGDFINPRGFSLTGKAPNWAADNDAFSRFDPDR